MCRIIPQSSSRTPRVAVAANITLLAGFHLNPVIHSMLSVPGFAVVNAMACLVFRRIKFGLISSDGVSKIPMTGLSENFHATANPRSFPLHLHHTDPSSAEFTTDTSFPLEVRTQTTVDKFTDGVDACHEISKITDLA